MNTIKEDLLKFLKRMERDNPRNKFKVTDGVNYYKIENDNQTWGFMDKKGYIWASLSANNPNPNYSRGYVDDLMWNYKKYSKKWELAVE